MGTGATPEHPSQPSEPTGSPADGMPAAAAAPPDVLPRSAPEVNTAAGVLARVRRISTWLGPWHDAIVAVHDAAAAASAAAATAAALAPPAAAGADQGAPAESTPPALGNAIAAANQVASQWCPTAAAYWLMGDDGGESVLGAVGPHAELLAIALIKTDVAWPHVKVPSHPSGGSAEWPQSPSETAEVALGVAAALEEASRHTALLLLVQRAARARVGERVDVGAALAEWDLPAEDTSKLLAWLVQEPPEFDGQPVPLVVDTATGSLYRTASDTWEKAYTTTAGLWGTILALGLVIAVFALLRAAHITTWPADWFPKLVVLYLCVVGGAAAHIASKALANISFDDPLTIYAASRGLDWLRLRWLSILRLLIPIVVVTGSLWGAGNIPTHFQDIGVAVLSGYSADSLFRNSIAKLSSTKS